MPEAKRKPEDASHSSPATGSAFTVEDAINGLLHVADDHQCCKPFLLATVAFLKEMQADKRPDFMGEALNSGDGTYKP